MVNLYLNDNNVSAIAYTSVRFRRIHNLAKRNVTTYKLARANGSKFVRAEYASKEIVIEGEIAAPSRDLMETSLDTLMSYLDATEARIEFNEGGALRRYYGTVTNNIITDPKGGYAPFAITILCSDPFAYDPTTTTLYTHNTITTTPVTDTITVAGGYRAHPLFTITVTSMTAASTAGVRITNPATGQYIDITRTWTNGDVLVIDTKNRTVKVNGTAVDYTGVFPYWALGSGSVTYSDTFTTRSVNTGATYQKRYL